MELHSGTTLVESVTAPIHICADYIGSGTLGIEWFKDMNTKTFFTVQLTIGSLDVPQGYDNGQSHFYTNLYLEFDHLSGYADDLGYANYEDD